MAPKKVKDPVGLPFAGKAADLNIMIFELLSVKNLTSYETFQELHRIKGFRHTKNQVVDRRMKNLHLEQWINEVGTKKNKLGENSPLFELSKRGSDALEMSKVSRIRFLMEANDELQEKMRKLLLEFRLSKLKKVNDVK
jgi:hypothetical protein